MKFHRIAAESARHPGVWIAVEAPGGTWRSNSSAPPAPLTRGVRRWVNGPDVELVRLSDLPQP